MFYNRDKEVDKHQNNHDYNKKKNTSSIGLTCIGLVVVMISLLLILVSLCFKLWNAFWAGTVFFVTSLIGTFCCIKNKCRINFSKALQSSLTMITNINNRSDNH